MSKKPFHVAALAALCLLSMYGCAKKEAVTPGAPTEQPSQEAAMAAILRGHPNSLRVCADIAWNGYMLDYGPMPAPSAPADGRMHGWYLLQNVVFNKSANNTWFISTQPDANYFVVYPDVTGLPCHAH